MQRAFNNPSIEVTIDERSPGMGTTTVSCIVIPPATKNSNFPVFNVYYNAIPIFNIRTTSYNVPIFRHSIIHSIIRPNVLMNHIA